MVDLFRWFEDLEIAQQVANDETEKDKTGDGHDGFLSDGRLPESKADGKIRRSGAHEV